MLAVPPLLPPPGVPVIGKRIRETTVKWVPLQLCVLLQVRVLMGGEKYSGIGRDNASIKLYRY